MTYENEYLQDLICKKCDFFKESEKDLECGAYKILRALLEKGVVAPEEIRDALAS